MNEPAFPYERLMHSGMTLRDYFAAKALGRLSLIYEIEVTDAELPEQLRRSKAYAKYAYELADAMLKERAK